MAMLCSALASLLLFATPPGDTPPAGADAPAALEELSGEEAPEQEVDPLVAQMLEELSPEARTRFEAMTEDEFQQLMQRSLAGETLQGEEQEIAAALWKNAIADLDGQLHYQTGDIPIGEGLATLHLGEQFRYLGPEDARRVLVEFWENPPEQGDSLGMIVPAEMSPVDPRGGWGVVITYTEDGHVEDDDADDIDYDELLEEMQEATLEANPDRESRGFPPMELVGWAATPRYDSETHRLYWAQELSVEGAPENTLNYAIRVLGRKGVLEMNAIGGMSQLDMIGPEMESVLSTVEFEVGHRYIDFDPDIDQVAAYGIGGLVAGKLLAKAGFFAVILKFLVAAKKFLLIGLIALGAFVKRLFSRKSED